ncbi:PA domain-containing protein [Marinicella meishanensis]|uniref:PA domain-containing protein n=1 Tax=Marinicella meishanensis TaxID=2873263 RepID=UPI001CC15623|nr:PA domain-containing protein [Marinicella sp. NBU2979]
MSQLKLRTPWALLALMTCGSAFGQATITINNTDGAGEGFNDPTPVAPIGGNTGTTLGEQRLIAFQRAADIWETFLDSDVEIVVNAAFNPLTCSQNGAVLGSAGAASVHADFANAPVADTWYNPSLASSLAGVDVNGAQAEINSQFNSELDNGCLNSGWYYGLDGATPQGFTAFLPVLLHEMGHGLGFQTFTSGTTGAFFSGRPDIWTLFMRDLSTGEQWVDMDNAERVASAINDPNLVWTGPNVTAEFPNVLGNPAVLTINSPGGIAGDYAVQTASFGPAIPEMGLTADVVLADDGTGGDVNDACEPIINDLTGAIAIVNRGSCNFTLKVINSQNAGAVAVLVANNVSPGLPPMGGSDPAVTIPSVGISLDDGALITGNLPGVNVTLGYDTGQFAGANGGFVRLYAPNPFEQGSSVSHFTRDANPNLLMEPSITPTIFDEIDLTLQLFQDIGWNTVEDLIFADDFE